MLEDPAILAGLPLLLLGLAGAAIGVLTMFAPERPQLATEQGRLAAPRAHAGAHPGPAQYVNIGILLAAITGVEVAVYYVDAIAGALVPILLVLSAAKFVLVVLFFMHLRFDNRLFSTLFSTGFVLATCVFIVVLATLGASLR